MGLTPLHLAGMGVTLAVIVLVGIHSGRHVQNASDFAVGGGKESYLMVAGALIGTLVGGSCTIGAAQGAYIAGLYGIWYMIGLMIGCLLAGFFYAVPIRKSGVLTLQELFSVRYGRTAGLVSSVLTVAGVLISIVVQMLAAVSLLSTALGLPAWVSALTAAALMLVYVTFGGMLGAGQVGIVKTLLLLSMTVYGIVYVPTHIAALPAALSSLPRETYFSLWAGNGLQANIASALSAVVGLSSSQMYIQVVCAARSDKVARRSMLFGGLFLVPVGAAMLLIGLYMRLSAPDIAAAAALPTFLLTHMSAFPAGVMIAALLITVIGSGSGVALSISTIITNDLYKRFARQADEKKELLVARLSLVAIFASGVVFALTNLGSYMLDWMFLSMALRSAVNFVPFVAVLFLRRRVTERQIILTMFVGLGVYLVWMFTLGGTLDPIFPGLGSAFLCYFVCSKRAAHAPAEA
ncbi:MAG TPA: sodium:solute symporter family protein [Oscillospiraceae bacterium]|nr:sodium:solute symporter family protein [Oscillospiraceae bacterium]